MEETDSLDDGTTNYLDQISSSSWSADAPEIYPTTPVPTLAIFGLILIFGAAATIVCAMFGAIMYCFYHLLPSH
jgi:hypothetical protein